MLFRSDLWPPASDSGDGLQLGRQVNFEMERKMAIETGAVGAAMAAKYGVIPKLAAMFCAAAGGAGIIAAYHPETRSETWWRALGAGIFGVPMGIAACTA